MIKRNMGKGQREKEQEIEELLSSLTKEEKKQWDSYSSHEQERIINRIETRVEHRLRYLSPSDEEQVDLKSAGRRECLKALPQGYSSGGKLQLAKKEFRVESRGRKKTDKHLQQKEISSENVYKPSEAGNSKIGNNHAPIIKDAVIHAEISNGIQDTYFCDNKPALSSKSRKQLKKILAQTLQGKSEYLKRENNFQSRAGPTAPVNRYESIKINKQELLNTFPKTGASNLSSDKALSFSELPRDEKYNISKKNFKRQKKHAGEVENKRKKLLRKEFDSFLAQEESKQKNIRQMQYSEQISISEAEREIGASSLRTISLPFRAKFSMIKASVTAKLTKAATGILKYVAGFGGVFILLLFIYLFFAALFGAIAGQEGNEPYYSASGDEIAAYAKEWIGITKYVYGAGRASPTDWQDYADCSSFVHGVFNHFGIELGGDTREMEHNGTIVEGGLANALPGDIILFYSGVIAPGNSSHVGIYDKDGMMVHCSGGMSNYSVETAGRGVCMGSVTGDGRPYEVRRIVTDVLSGNGIDPTVYTQSQMETIWAVVCQEDGGSYAGALAVISTAMNRVDSPQWCSLGRNAYQQLTAPGQFCYSIDTYWQKYLNGNVPDYVKQAVSDCLDRGIRNHSHTSFRSYYTEGSEQIGGGNYYFG